MGNAVGELKKEDDEESIKKEEDLRAKRERKTRHRVDNGNSYEFQTLKPLMLSPFQQVRQKSCISLTFLCLLPLSICLSNNGFYYSYKESSDGTLQEINHFLSRTN